MAQINVVLRTLVRIMYGTALMPGTRADALASFRRAAELAPQRLIHRWVLSSNFQVHFKATLEAGRVALESGRAWMLLLHRAEPR